MKKNTQKTIKTSRKYVTILDINIDSSQLDSVLMGVEQKVSHNIKFSIMTPNPELVLMAQDNLKLKNALNSATYSIPDGVGLNYASEFLFNKPLNIIKGRVLFMELIKLASQKGWKVFLLGGLDNEAELSVKHLISLYPNILISFAGGPLVTTKLSSDIVKKINSFKPDLLFVAFGNPKQEIFIYKNAKKLNAKCIMAVGGTFRYVAGLTPFPPKWMKKLGLEWVWRVIAEPKRIGRIFNAFILFPLRVFWFKITGN